MRFIQSLEGEWKAREAGKSRAFAAFVPGCIHTDLLAAGEIPDPYFRDNEERLQWIGEKNWVYARAFTPEAGMFQGKRVLLQCDGLDTFASITLNGRVLGETDNMYRAWEFDVTGLLKQGANTLEVRFDSVLPYLRQREEQRKLPSWGGPREIRGRAWVRKEPCNFGWDWGPVLITCGIWRGIRLVAFDTARLAQVRVDQDHSAAGRGEVGLTILAEAEKFAPAAGLTVRAGVSLRGKTIATAEAPLKGKSATLKTVVKKAELWWPNNMGAQPLYDVRVEILSREGVALDVWEKRVGLRELRLDRHKDQWGETFQFTANGVPFFAKGASWIPTDTFAPRVTPEFYRHQIAAARGANMNMLRVWGGGIYESDIFYDLCDEMGLCVWQDFMFACSTYPVFDEEFMNSVRAEAVDNLRRLRHHPCIALWCGNNELEMGLVGDQWTDKTMSWKDYSKLFDRMLRQVAKREDPARDYWPGSPHSSGADRKDSNSPNSGDAHLWAVWHGRQPFEWYRDTYHRFCSEFGFQSFPEPAGAREYTAAEDRNVTSYVMEHHQRSGIGNTVILQYMLDWFLVPRDYDSTLRLSQILHGMAMKYAIEHWRRNMPRCMGALYWQINDCWPVASWASLDWKGRFKALHYMARNFFAPLLVSCVEDRESGAMQVHVTSDRLKSEKAELRWTLTDASGNTLQEGKKNIATPANANALALSLDFARFLKLHGARDLIFWARLWRDGACVSENAAFFARPKHVLLKAPGISIRAEKAGEREFRVRLSAKAPALWTWLESDLLALPETALSDNYFHLLPGGEKEVIVRVHAPLTLKEFQNGLRARSLWDTFV